MNSAHGFFPQFPLEWEMSAAEQFTLVGLLAQLRPEVAIEIGTHHGGSLQVLAAFCREVHSIDLDPGVPGRLAATFPGVRFHTGDSHALLPRVLAGIANSGRPLGFVLVDGDHTARGVQGDIAALLRHRPAAAVHVLLHDSFNPDCRRGMRAVAWADCPHVHAVDLDFVPGAFVAAPERGAFARSMWGGFARVELRPEPRTGALEIQAAQEALHAIVFRHSAHRLWHKLGRRLRRFARRPAPPSTGESA